MRLGIRGSLLAVLVAAGAFWYAHGSMPSLLGSVESVSTRVSTLVESAIPTQTTIDQTGPGWATCSPVPVLVNPGSGSDRTKRDRIADARRALARVSAVSGVTFQFAGTSDETPTGAWAHTDVRVDGYDFAPVLIGWVETDRTDMIADGTWGATVANPANVNGARQLVTGAIALDQASDAELTSGQGAGLTRGSVLLHELGHLAGLRHDDDGLMAPVVNSDSPGGFSAQERAALSSLAPSCR